MEKVDSLREPAFFVRVIKKNLRILKTSKMMKVTQRLEGLRGRVVIWPTESLMLSWIHASQICSLIQRQSRTVHSSTRISLDRTHSVSIRARLPAIKRMR